MMFAATLNTRHIERKPIAAVPFDKCAAKTTRQGMPGTTVVEHCENVGRVASVITDMLPEGVKAMLPANPGLAVSVHDVGKVSPGYELKYFKETIVRLHAPDLCGMTSFSTHHASVSAAAIDHWLNTPHMKSPLAVAAAAHHGALDRGYPPDLAESLGGSAWAEERRKLIEKLIAVFGGSLQEASEANPWVLAGLTCVSDWIGSDERFFPSGSPSTEQASATRKAERAVRECGFRSVSMKPDLSFEAIFGFQPREAQRQFLDRISRRGLYVLEAPMGIGKTEAALYAAYRLMETGQNRGFYFALPTRLTSDRIHGRVSAFLSRISDDVIAPRLAHGTAWLSEYANGGEDFGSGQSWFNPSKRALLYPFAVGTVDQALLSVLNVKHNFVRLFGLAGKVVILDEVHSYDMYTGTLLDELVCRLLSIECTVIVLSATLTGERRQRLAPAFCTLPTTEDYPLMSGLEVGGDVFTESLSPPEPKRVSIRLESWDTRFLAQAVVAAAGRGQCVVCIANTVARAQAWYRAIKSEMPGDAFPVGILHSRFPMFQREAIENEWMERLGKASETRPNGSVLVATQILEQSVDIDADWMLSELAPTDMMLQRMGRLWRHDRDHRTCSMPEFVIVTRDPSDCTTTEAVVDALGRENASVYAPYVLMRTHAVWRSLKAVVLPSDIRSLVEKTYAASDEAYSPVRAAFLRKLQENCDHLRKLATSAKDTNRGFPTAADDTSARTRHSDLPTRTMLLLDGRPEMLGGGAVRVRLLDGTEWGLTPKVPDFSATRHLHANTVSVAAHLLQGSGVRDHSAWLERHFFDKPVVMIVGEGGVLSGLDEKETVLRYSPDYGVWRGDDKSLDFKRETEPSHAQTEDDAFDPITNDW